MSYDLYFVVPEGRDAVSIEEFAGYFGARPRYRVDGAQAIYRNGNTGVAFAFDYVDPEGDMHDLPGFEEEGEELESPLPDGWKSAHVCVSLNYLRPHTFGLEAVPEIEDFVAAFDLSVDDPQTDGMGRGAFRTEEFLSGWNEGNRLAYEEAVAQFLERNPDHADRLPSLPTAEIERCWNWNYAADSLQERLGEALTVPPIRYLRDAEGIRSFTVWTDAEPTVIPRTDSVVLVLDALAPKRGLLRRKRNTVAIVPHADVLRALESRPVGADHVEPYHLVSAKEPSARVRDLFESAAPIEHEPEGVPAESILNREWLEQALAAARSKQT